MRNPLIRLECGVNSYDWGKIGKTSAAAKFAAATASGFSIQEEKPYAELWMGTHPSLPSKDLETQRTLLDLVQDNQALLSADIAERYENKLPFLFKVLSINKALSIQAHPNKKLAEQLHAKDPKNYPDDNHKPEMTIAVTPFDGLCGFRPLAEITHFLKTIPSLRKLVGEEEAKKFEDTIKGKETSEKDEDVQANKKALQSAFTKVMNTDKDALASASKELIKAAESEGAQFAGEGGPSNDGKELADLVIRLNSQFPEDIGLFVQFFLNYVKLEIGEAMFLKADDIHAYLSGDIIECMASSDNVVRAGFTPKFKDVDTLTTMLTYSYAPISEQKMDPTDYPYVTLNAPAYSSNSGSLLYNPPIPEFAVVRTALNRTGAKATFDPIEGPSIILCTKGKGTISVGNKEEAIEEGYVFFVGATAEVVIKSDIDAEDGEGLVTFKAFCEIQDEKEKL
ncbi:mannose-6-phosphate isomeras-like protein [Cucurbitaria berberidis CBS 394.84]|uniref:Mannose-6-phosphate isomerase n=1 Tax=Cucurbitaria berberidis CBS 394.84 TaxID=1168544 RepID=A0A9P4LCG5_9PLEO|nr:mannose-6-phosphate isomeras-like protein [Cucurbitaria berberidis CBS 394.84]KAF1849352.1 mannose-6-phosphate isomeras-like protein [Cucurbitaria berberidis CBS 394.84]